MTIPSAISRLTLVSAPTPRSSGSPVVRRYRLGRPELNRCRDCGAGRFEHLKRVYD